MVNAWKQTKKERVASRKQIEIRKRVELLVKMKKELQQAHKSSLDGSSDPKQWWPLVDEWEEAKREAR